MNIIDGLILVFGSVMLLATVIAWPQAKRQPVETITIRSYQRRK